MLHAEITSPEIESNYVLEPVFTSRITVVRDFLQSCSVNSIIDINLTRKVCVSVILWKFKIKCHAH